MAARPWGIVSAALGIILTLWVWVLAAGLFLIVWAAIDRPSPPIKDLFPYGEMRIGIDPSYPPFAATTGSDLFGLDVDLGKALGERLGIPVRFVPLGFDGLYDAIKADRVDIVISALLVDPSRTAEVSYTQAYFDAGLVLVSNSDSPIPTMFDAGGHKLAFEFGSEADTQARSWIRRVETFETQPYELPQYALDAVRLRVADAALVDAVSARLYLRDHPGWNVTLSYLTHAPYAIALRIDRGGTWEVVNRTLGMMMEDGTLDMILARWL